MYGPRLNSSRDFASHLAHAVLVCSRFPFLRRHTLFSLFLSLSLSLSTFAHLRTQSPYSLSLSLSLSLWYTQGNRAISLPEFAPFPTGYHAVTHGPVSYPAGTITDADYEGPPKPRHVSKKRT
jgi:hypothetical protein